MRSEKGKTGRTVKTLTAWCFAVGIFAIALAALGVLSVLGFGFAAAASDLALTHGGHEAVAEPPAESVPQRKDPRTEVSQIPGLPEMDMLARREQDDQSHLPPSR